MKIILGFLLCGIVHALPYNKTQKFEEPKIKTDLKTKEDKLFTALFPKVLNHTGVNGSRTKKQAPCIALCQSRSSQCCPCTGTGTTGIIGTTGIVGTSGTYATGGNVVYGTSGTDSSSGHLTTYCQSCVAPGHQPCPSNTPGNLSPPNPVPGNPPIFISSNPPQSPQQFPIFISSNPPQSPQQFPIFISSNSSQSPQQSPIFIKLDSPQAPPQQAPVYVNVESPYPQPPGNVNPDHSGTFIGLGPNQGPPGYTTTSGTSNKNSANNHSTQSEKTVQNGSDGSSKCDKDTYVVMPPVDTQSSVTYVQFPIIQQQTPVFPQIVVGRSKLIEACFNKDGSQPVASDSDSYSGSVSSSSTSSTSSSSSSSETASSGTNSFGPSYGVAIPSTAPSDGGDYQPGPFYQPGQYHGPEGVNLSGPSYGPEGYHQKHLSTAPTNFDHSRTINQPGPFYQPGQYYRPEGVNLSGPSYGPEGYHQKHLSTAPTNFDHSRTINQPGTFYQPGQYYRPEGVDLLGPSYGPEGYHQEHLSTAPTNFDHSRTINQPGPFYQPGPFNGFGSFNQPGPLSPQGNLPRPCVASTNSNSNRFPTTQGYWMPNRDQHNNPYHPAMLQPPIYGAFQQMQQQGDYLRSFPGNLQASGFEIFRTASSDESNNQIPQLDVVPGRLNASEDQMTADNLVKRYFSRSIPADKTSKRDSEVNSHLQADVSSVESQKVKPQQFVHHGGKVSTSAPPPDQVSALKKNPMAHLKSFKNDKSTGEFIDASQSKVVEKKKFKN